MIAISIENIYLPKHEAKSEVYTLNLKHQILMKYYYHFHF